MKITMMTPNVNDPDICQALAEACNRGVEINIVMGKHHNDAREVKWGGTNSEAVANLVRMIKRSQIHNLHIKWAVDGEKKLVTSEEKFVVHVKSGSIDDKLMYGGTSPLDKQAMYFSSEADIFFESEEKAREFNKKFFHLKFIQGKDYFDDLYDELIRVIEHQIGLLNNLPESIDRKIANKMRDILTIEVERTTPDTSGYKKMIHLLTAIIPTLKKTSCISKNVSCFYTTVMKKASQAGLTESDLNLSYTELSHTHLWRTSFVAAVTVPASAVSRALLSSVRNS
jgi:hypothetical protein